MPRGLAQWAILAGIVAFTLVASRLTWMTAAARDAARFENAVQALEDRVSHRMTTYENLLRAGVAHLQSGGDVESFTKFVRKLDVQSRFPGIQGIGFTRRVTADGLDDLLRERRQAGDPGFRVWPDHPREEYHAIVVLEPLDRRNRAAIGFDMYSEPVRREAMSRARDSGQPALSGRVILVQELDPVKQAGFLLYLPVYAGGDLPATVEERRARLIGFVYAPFRAEDFLSGIFGREEEPRLRLDVFDGPAANPETFLARAGNAVAGHEPDIRQEDTLELGGRRWTLRFASLPTFEKGSRRPFAWLVLLSGSAIALMSLVLFRSQSRAEEERGFLLESERRARYVAESLNRIGAGLSAELDIGRLVQLVTDEATRVTGAQFGAFFRNAVDESGESYLLYTLSGADPAKFASLGSPRNTTLFGITFRGEGVVRIDDVRKDPRYGKNAPHYGLPKGHLPVASYLAVPVVSRSGRVIGGIFLGHPEVARFREEHERIVVGIAGQAAIALDNAELYAQAREADRRKDEFIAMLSHELRNPLSPIVTTLELMRLKPEDTRVQTRAREVLERQTRRMARLVDDLLDVSRITRGKIQLRQEGLDLRTVLQRAAEVARSHAAERGQHVAVRLPGEPVPLLADPVRIEQVVANLLENAVKYTGNGGHIALEARVEADQAVVEVSDDGIGIPRDALPSIFDMFVQADRSLDRSKGGLGIGLTLVRRLVEMHGGTVDAHSEGPGKGSRFRVRLPLADPSVLAMPAPSSPPQAASRRVRVLVVDDNPDIVRATADFLGEHGHEVRTASDGPRALEIAQAFTPDLVLLDLGLPGMNGYQVASSLRRLPSLAHTRIVAVSGYAMATDRERSKEAGFDDHIAKPVPPERLMSLLEAMPPG